MKKDFISLNDFSRQELEKILDLADEYKKNPHSKVLENKVLGLIFTKSSTRTRVSFEVAMMHLGGNSIFLSSRDIQIGRGETIADTAKVLSRYIDIIAIRTHAHEDVLELAKHADIPVVNGLSDLLHPCQLMADMQTIRKIKGGLKDLKVTYVGDAANNMAYSWINASRIFEFDLVLACPEKYTPAIEYDSSRVTVTQDPVSAAVNADVLYTDVWVSMGQEEETEQRLKEFDGFQIDSRLIQVAKPDVSVMHCLPAHRGQEISADAIDGPNSVVFDQAENRLHINKAVFTYLLT